MAEPLRKIISASVKFHTWMVLSDVASKQNRTLSWLVNQICETRVIEEDRQRELVNVLNELGRKKVKKSERTR